MKKFILFLIMIILCTGCASDTVLNSYAVVKLDANATTGYEWICDIEDSSIIGIYDEEYIINDDVDIVGAPGVKEFTFEAYDEGSTTITLTYERTFEDEEPIYKIVYEISVDKNMDITVNEKNGTYSSSELPDFTFKKIITPADDYE